MTAQLSDACDSHPRLTSPEKKTTNKQTRKKQSASSPSSKQPKSKLPPLFLLRLFLQLRLIDRVHSPHPRLPIQQLIVITHLLLLVLLARLLLKHSLNIRRARRRRQFQFKRQCLLAEPFKYPRKGESRDITVIDLQQLRSDDQFPVQRRVVDARYVRIHFARPIRIRIHLRRRIAL